MADLILEELATKIFTEVDTFKNQNGDKIDPDRFNNLILRIKYHIEKLKYDINCKYYQENTNAIRETAVQDSGTLLNPQLKTLEELNEKILNQIDKFKHESDSNNVQNEKYEIDCVQHDNTFERDVEKNKAHALIKLQTSATLVTSHIISLLNNP